MSEPQSYSYTRYLEAKITVDRRALNERVWRSFLRGLEQSSPRVRILEVGGGIGASARRIIESLVPRSIEHVQYTFVDLRQENVETARRRLMSWAQEEGFSSSQERDTLQIDGEDLTVRLRFVTADLFDFADAYRSDDYDALVGQALFDLLPLQRAFRRLRPLLSDDGLWYLPIHFDGVTAFEPPLEPDLDRRIEQLYHDSMSEKGNDIVGAHTGRRILSAIGPHDISLLEAGSSDWVVFARQEGGTYPYDEDYFLYHIFHFVEEELTGHPELGKEVLHRWAERRRDQIERGQLIYIAHQLDVLCRNCGTVSERQPS